MKSFNNYFVEETGDSKEAQRVLNSFCKKYKIDTHAFVVKENGKTIFESYNNSNENSVFGIGSISKSIDKIAIMSLVEQNKIDLDDKIFKFGFDEVKDGINLVNYFDWYGWDEITVDHCMRHRSGIADHMNEIPEFNYHYGEYGKEKDPDMLTVLRAIAKYPLHFKANKEKRYSNTNFYLLCKMIEYVTKSSYGNAMNDLIFKEVGMNNTYWAYESTEPKGLVPSYVLDQSSNELIDKFEIKPFDAWAIFYSTPKDMMALADSYLNNEIISQKTRDSYFDSKENTVSQKMGAIHDGFQCAWNVKPDSGLSYTFMINVFGQSLLDPFVETTDNIIELLGK